MSQKPINIQGPGAGEEEEELSPIDEILAYVANTPYNTNPNILRQMLVALQNEKHTPIDEKISEVLQS